MNISEEVNYQRLTISIRDEVTGQETAITGLVKGLSIKLEADRPEWMDLNPTVEWALYGDRLFSTDSGSISLRAKWVVEHGQSYLVTILDEPFEIPEENKETK